MFNTFSSSHKSSQFNNLHVTMTTTSLHLGSHMNYFQLQCISYTMGLFARGRVGRSFCQAGPTHDAQFPWRKQCL